MKVEKEYANYRLACTFGKYFFNSHIEKHERIKFSGMLGTPFKPERAQWKNPILLVLFLQVPAGLITSVHHLKILCD